MKPTALDLFSNTAVQAFWWDKLSGKHPCKCTVIEVIHKYPVHQHVCILVKEPWPFLRSLGKSMIFKVV